MTTDGHDASTDAMAREIAGNGREVKFGRMLEHLIEHSEYRRNRKKISSRLGISGARPNLRCATVSPPASRRRAFLRPPSDQHR